MNAKKKQLLLDFPWNEHYPRLVAFAEWLIQGKNWNSGSLPKGQTAESIVQEVIAKTFNEKRNWDPDRGDLLNWLKWVIRSDVSHLAESAANRLDGHLDLADENDYSADGPTIERRQPSLHRLLVGSPEEAIMEEEKMAEAQEKIDALLEASSGHPELEEIVYAIIDGKCNSKPQELSDVLGRPVKEINQNLRALRRRAEKIRAEARNGRK